MSERRVLVVGAGPAGSAAALYLARAGLDVTLVETRSGPKGPPCGEGIMPAGVPVLADLGLLDRALLAGARVFKGIAYNSRSGIEARGEFPRRGIQPWGLAIRRRVLDTLLREALGTMPNLELLESHHAVDILHDGGGVRGIVARDRSGRRSRRITADLTVGADGIFSRFHTLPGVRATRPPWRRYGIRIHATGIRGLSDRVEVHLIPGGEIYVTPQSPEEATIAVMLEEPAVPRGHNLTDHVVTLLRSAPNLGSRCRDVAVEGRAGLKGPMGLKVRSCYGTGYILVGDAAGALDPISGEGVALGLVTGRALGQAVQAHGLGPQAIEQAVRVRRGLESSLGKLTGALLFCARHPALAGFAIGIVRVCPPLFDGLLGIAMADETGAALQKRAAGAVVAPSQ